MGNLGFMEIGLIAVLALIVFGPNRLPEIARQIGRALREVRKVSSEFEREVKTTFELDAEHSTYLAPRSSRPAPAGDTGQPSRPPPGQAPGHEQGSPGPDDAPAEPV